ncbi:hypothetical protein ACHQM5_022234 [Ranunculus cassubicifolius]
MEKTTASPFLSLANFLWFLLLDGTSMCVVGFRKFYSSSRYLFQFQFQFLFGSKSNEKVLYSKLSSNAEIYKEMLHRDEVEMVLGQLRLEFNHDEEMIQERLGPKEMSVLFEEMEPSLHEIKEAFDVFDENRDGFMDVTELQRVLCSLGFREGSNMEVCEEMIRAYDDNRDGRIDFHEFIKLMEKSFC